MANDFSVCFAWPASSLPVSLSCERSVFFGQLPLPQPGILMIGGIFQILPEGGVVTTGLGQPLKELLHGMDFVVKEVLPRLC